LAHAFPLRLAVVVVRKAMVAYPPPPGNMTGGMPLILGSGDCELHQVSSHQWQQESARQTENYEQSAIELLSRFGIETANNAPDPVAAQGNHLVGHDLRENSKPVGWFGFDGGAQGQIWLNVRRDRANENGRQILELIGLHDDTGPRPSQLAWNDDKHDVSAFHFHSLQS
jgi:hypothetical protein